MNDTDERLAALFSVMLDIVRTQVPKQHIAKEFLCTSLPDSGADTKDAADPFYLTPAEQFNREAGALLSRAGRLPSVVHIGREEDQWFVDQDEAGWQGEER